MAVVEVRFTVILFRCHREGRSVTRSLLAWVFGLWPCVPFDDGAALWVSPRRPSELSLASYATWLNEIIRFILT